MDIESPRIMLMDKNAKRNAILNSLAILFSLFIFVISLFKIDNQSYRLIPLLSLSYLVFTFIFYNFNKKIINQNQFIGLTWALFIFFVRYVLLPLSLIISENYTGFGPDPQEKSINNAIFLMIAELFFSYLVITFALKYYYNRYCNFMNEANISKEEPVILNNKSFLFLYVLVSLIILIILAPQHIFPQISLLFTEVTLESTTTTAYNGLFQIMGKTFKIGILLLGLSICNEKFKNTGKNIYIFLAAMVSLLFLFLSIGTSRWSLLFSFILCLYLMKKIFIKIPKVFILSSIALLLAALFAISIYKFRWAIYDNPLKDIIKILMTQFQDYFSGPRPIAQTIEMKEVFANELNIKTFVNDFLGSIPIINKSINPNQRTNIFFNLYNNLPIGNSSLIIPMVGIGYIYFPFFPMIFTCICVFLIIKLDFSLINRSYDFVYIILSFSFMLGLCMGFNTQIIFGNFVTSFLPIWIILKLNSKIKNGRRANVY